MEIVLTTTFNTAGLAACGGLKSASRAKGTARTPSPASSPNRIRPSTIHGESVEGYKRGAIVARYLWCASEHAPEGWWRSSAETVDVSPQDASPTDLSMPRTQTATPPMLELVLGRDSQACDVVVPLRLEHGPLLSRRHCALRLSLATNSPSPTSSPASSAHFGACVVHAVDLGSRNGTFVNGTRLAPSTDVGTPAGRGSDETSRREGPDRALDPPSTTKMSAVAAVGDDDVRAGEATPIPFHPLLDSDVAMGVAPLLTLAFGTGAAVPVGGELPDDALRLRFHVYVRVLWRTASWELERQRLRPQPRLAAPRVGTSVDATESCTPTQGAHEEEKHADRIVCGHDAHTIPRAATSPVRFVMSDVRGGVHVLQPTTRTHREEHSQQHEKEVAHMEETTQDDWFEAMRHTFDGDTRTAQALAHRPSDGSVASSLYHDAREPPMLSASMSSDAVLRADAGLQWFVNQLGGERVCGVETTIATSSLAETKARAPRAFECDEKAHDVPREETSAVPLPPALPSSPPAHLDGAVDKLEHNRSTRMPSATRIAHPLLTSFVPTAAADGKHIAAHDLARAVVAHHTAIGEDGMTRPSTTTTWSRATGRVTPEKSEDALPRTSALGTSPNRHARSPWHSPSLSPAQLVRPSAPSGEEVRFSHVLGGPREAHARAQDEAQTADMRMTAETEVEEDDAPVLVRSRRTSDRRTTTTMATKATEVSHPLDSTSSPSFPRRTSATLDPALPRSPASPLHPSSPAPSQPSPSPSQQRADSTVTRVRLVHSAERLSSQPLAHRRLSLVSLTSSRVVVDGNTARANTDSTPLAATPWVESGGDVIDLAMTPPPEPIVVDDGTDTEEGVASTVAGAAGRMRTVAAGTVKKKLSKKQQKAADATATITLFLQELHDTDGLKHPSEATGSVSPLFFSSNAAGTGSLNPRRRSRQTNAKSDAEANALEVLAQIHQEVCEDTGTHAHIPRLRSQRTRADATLAAPSPYSPAGLAKVLAATLRAGLAIGEAHTKPESSAEDDGDDDVALGDLLSLSSPTDRATTVEANDAGCTSTAVSICKESPHENAEEEVTVELDETTRPTVALERLSAAAAAGPSLAPPAPRTARVRIAEDADGRPTTSTIHLSPRVSFDGAHHRAAAAIPRATKRPTRDATVGLSATAATSDGAEKQTETWCVFIATQAPSTCDVRAGDGTHSARPSSTDPLLGQDVDGASLTQFDDVPLLARCTRQEVLSAHVLDSVDEDGDAVRAAHIRASRGRADVDVDCGAEIVSQYTTERAWIMTCADMPEGSQADDDVDHHHHRHSKSMSTRSSALFQTPSQLSHHPSQCSPRPSAFSSSPHQPMKGKAAKKTTRRQAARTPATTSIPEHVPPPLSQLLSLDIQSYLVPPTTAAAVPSKGDGKRADEAAVARCVPLLRSYSPRATAAQIDQNAAQKRRSALLRGVHRRSIVPPFADNSDEEDDEECRVESEAAHKDNEEPTAAKSENTSLPRLPAAVDRALYPHQRAALRFLWRSLLRPSVPRASPVSSSSVSVPTSLSRLLDARSRPRTPATEDTPCSEVSDVGISGKTHKKRRLSGYRPLITVSDIADILEAHHPPKPVVPPTRSRLAELSASQVFGHEQLEHRASQLLNVPATRLESGVVSSDPPHAQERTRRTGGVDERNAVQNESDTAAASATPVLADTCRLSGIILAHAAGLGKSVTTVAFLLQLWSATAAHTSRDGHDAKGGFAAESPWRALPLVFRSRAEGGRGGVRTVLCVPKQGLPQWTRTLETWLTLAKRGTHQVFVLYQEGRSHAKASAALLTQWASLPATEGALLIITHTWLAALFSAPRGVRGEADACDGLACSTAKTAKKKAPLKNNTNAKSKTPPPPPPESFWEDELLTEEDSAEDEEHVDGGTSDGKEAVALPPSADSRSTVAGHHARTKAAKRRPTKRTSSLDTSVPARETLLGGDDDSASELPTLGSDVCELKETETRAADEWTQCAHICRDLLLNYTTLLIVDEADRLTDTVLPHSVLRRTTSPQASASPTVPSSTALSMALAQFPTGTVRIALTSRLPSLLMQSTAHRPSRSALAGLLRFTHPDQSVTSKTSTASLLAMYRQSHPPLMHPPSSVPHHRDQPLAVTTSASRMERCAVCTNLVATPCLSESIAAHDGKDNHRASSHHERAQRETPHQKVEDIGTILERTLTRASTTTRATSTPASAAPCHSRASTFSAGVHGTPVPPLPLKTDAAITGFPTHECTPAEVHRGALPELVETTLIFDMSPVQAALLRELVRDLATPAGVTTTSSPSTLASQLDGSVHEGDDQRATPSAKDIKSTKKGGRPTARLLPSTAKARRRELSPTAATAESDAADALQVSAPRSSDALALLPSTCLSAFTTYALYISNQCDLVRDWCERQGIHVNTTVAELDAHEKRCAANPARRARWAIASLLTPSVFSVEAPLPDDAEHDDVQGASPSPTPPPVCMEALAYSWKMRGLFFLLRSALARHEKVVVFSHSLKTLVLIAWLIDRGNHLVDGLDFALVSGALSMRQRDQLYTTFNDASSPLAVLLLTFEVAHSGIDLYGADRVVLFDISRSVESEVQAVTRAFRLSPSCSSCSTSSMSSNARTARKLFVNRLLSNEPVEINSLPMASLQALALHLITASPLPPTPNLRVGDTSPIARQNVAETSQKKTASTRRGTGTRTCVTKSDADEALAATHAVTASTAPVSALESFIHDVARLDIKTGFARCFAAALAVTAGACTSPSDNPNTADVPSDALRGVALPQRTTVGGSLPFARVGTSRGSAAPAPPRRTWSRALTSTGGFFGLSPEAVTAAAEQSARRTSSPPPSYASPGAVSPARACARRRGRSATPPPPPLLSRRADTVDFTVGALVEWYVAQSQARSGVSTSLLDALPSVHQCTAHADEHVHAPVLLEAKHTSQYVVPAMLAYAQLAEARRRQRLQMPHDLTSHGQCCQDPVVADLVVMDEVRDILSLHFHEHRIWNALNGSI